MTKKFCFCCPVVLLWLILATSMRQVVGFLRDHARSDSAVVGQVGHPDTIRCWQVSGRLPHYNQQGQVDSFITMSRRLYVDGPLMMYVYNGSQYYLFHKDSLSGICWDIRRPDLEWSFRVDSLRRMTTPYLTHFGLFKKGFGRLISTAIDARTGSLKETYYDISFHQHPNADSCYVIYTDRFSSLPPDMSLSYSLDSLYGRRLCEVRLVMRTAGAAATATAAAAAPTSAAAPTTAAAESGSGMARSAEWSWKLQEIRDFDRATIQSYFSR